MKELQDITSGTQFPDRSNGRIVKFIVGPGNNTVEFGRFQISGKMRKEGLTQFGIAQGFPFPEKVAEVGKLLG
jgi:hypothetical protein